MSNTSKQQSAAVVKSPLVAAASEYGIAKVNKPAKQSFILAVFAGVFIAIAFIFYISVTTGSTMGWGMTRLVGGLAFSMGLMLVIAAGAELFTSTVLTTVGWAHNKITVAQQLQCWTRVYFGNMLGAFIMVCMIFAGGLFALNDGQWGLTALKIAQHKLHHTWGQAFVLGIMCNMLVCLAVWMTFATKDLFTKCFIVMLPVAMFVCAGFEHCIANMFMIPMGIVIAEFAPESFWLAANVEPAQFSDLTLVNYIGANLIPVTLGNIVGGAVIVGLGYWLADNTELLGAKAQQAKQQSGTAAKAND
ncbi:formate transporter FocA [Shewanella maritima]|uniref:Formate transporter FocA n=1 Tax=Shewanella maritima TaxID=2520507 RepID=A0A411PLD1_9GAMM|nr:formate transporter FocA [Shewanella maritima]QBF84360.1 formate transporter FocA [Shewanella maritima]